MDLRNTKLTDDSSISLDGEWIFYPTTLENPLPEKQHAPDTKIISVPSKGGTEIHHSFGTYKLRILLNPDQKQMYGIRVPLVNTASKLFINGRPIAQAGEVAKTSGQHKGQYSSYTAFFATNQSEIELVMQVSNFDTPEKASIKKSIKFGSAASIIDEQQSIKTTTMMIIAILLLYSLYTILIYFFIYPKKIILFFTVGFLFTALDEFINYNKSILEWLHFDYDWSIKIIQLVYLVSAFFLVQLIRSLLMEYNKARVFRWFNILYGLAALYIFILPIPFIFFAESLFSVLYLGSFLTVIVLALKLYIQKKEESFFLALTALSTTSGVIWVIIKSVSSYEIPFYPFDYLFAFLGFSLFWIKRFQQLTIESKQLVTQLQQADKLKDEFLANSSQQLWSPLNEMITIAQTVHDRNKGSMPTEDKNDLKFLIDIGRSMSFMLNDLLDFTRLKERAIHIHPTSTNIQAALAGVFDILRFLTEAKKVQLLSTIPASFPNVLADEKRLIQILFNLLHYTIKCTSEGAIVVHAECKDSTAIIQIRSPGLTINEEILNDSVLMEHRKELGLKVCKQLIELHGGSLRVHTMPDQEPFFLFTLPIAEEQMQQTAKTEMHSNGEGNVRRDHPEPFQLQEKTADERRFTILAIDDDPIHLKVIHSIFPSEKYEVVTVTNSKDALNLLHVVDWDLIILDAMMPDMSGYEFVRLIREKYSMLELPILLLTARSYPEDVYTGFALGANDYVTKPINSLELKIRSQALIDLKHSISERLRMEAAWLQAQIQPHFLFNTLNTIASLSTIDTSRMVHLLNKFGHYLRKSFDVKNLQRVVPVEHELELVRSYLYIEKERFGDRLQIIWEIDEKLKLDIPPLSIQPLVENAIHHGVLQKAKGGTICIRITDHPTFTTITIIDDGVGMNEEKLEQVLNEKVPKRKEVGLININKRLKRIYGQGLQIKSSPTEGTEITFTIPKLI
ncbi:ATP-binding protein [Bacillus sp. REN10]|uniref:hybrid sensor histidine kinase/response regulator n=1 Tax=Bacillus sp. REN10 TaxID=2782541 RepID=UPI00193B10DA|nr:ATP-binding protein [Bacillus sp. REN10]